jgi:hypothetical protein
LSADCVAKLFAALRESNNRIRLNDVLNQCCALAFVLESTLLILIAKIVLQHNLPPTVILASAIPYPQQQVGPQ